MIVVSNSGLLIALAKIERLTLLQSLYQEVLIPKAVEQEVVGMGIETVTPALEQLIASGFRMDDELRQTAQRLAGE